jgi:hypothetical protein
MMRLMISGAAVLCLSSLLSTAQTTAPSISGLPPNAVVIETQRVPQSAHANRLLVLWMQSPEKHDREMDEKEPYTCPELTRGSYFSGPTRVSLTDSRSAAVILSKRERAVRGSTLTR